MTKNNQKQAKSTSKIPEFTSYEEEAKWWDSHSLADLQDELKTVKARFATELSEMMNIRLDKLTKKKLRKEANRRGIGPTTLVRMWVLERLATVETNEDKRRRPKISKTGG